MITFDTPDELLDWWRDRRMETNSRRLGQQEYAARCRSYDQGVQWISRGTGSGGVLDSHAIRIFKSTGNANLPNGGPQPLRTTLNEITKNIRQTQASSAPAKLDVHSTPSYGIGRPTDVVDGDICEAIANATIEDSGLLGVARTTNFERCIDAMHGFGFALERSVVNGQSDMRIQAFTFNGYQLTLDPLNLNPNLQAHEYVGHTEVMSVDAVSRRFGNDQLSKIDTENLRSVGNLSPMENKFYAMTGGRLFPEMAHNSKAKGLFVHTIFLRGVSKRFDRMYIILDTGSPNGGGSSKTQTVVNWESNSRPGGGNPYGGSGLPLFCLYGYPRPGDMHGVSDVGLMVDAQDKLNIAASIYFQSLWNHVNKLLVVDRSALEDKKTSATDIMRQMRQGLLFVNHRDRYSQNPQVVQMPQPPGQVGVDIERFKQDVQSANFRAGAAGGEVKTHVSGDAQSRAIEQVEVSLEDRIDQDIAEYEKCIETMVCTQIRLAQARIPSAVRMMFEAGLSDEQFGMLDRIDPMRQLPKLRISESAIRRRSRSQRKQDIVTLTSAGVFANDPTEVRRLMAGLDMELSESDRSHKQNAEVAAAKVALGQPHQPYIMGAGAAYFIDALQRAAAQSPDPEARKRINEMILLQRQIEAEALSVGQPQAGAEQPQQAQEATFSEIMNAAFDPNAA